MKVSTKFNVDTTIRCLVIELLLLIRYVTSWPWHLTFDLGQWSYMAGHVVNPSTKFEDPFDYPFLSHEFWHLQYKDTIDYAFAATAHVPYNVTYE